MGCGEYQECPALNVVFFVVSLVGFAAVGFGLVRLREARKVRDEAIQLDKAFQRQRNVGSKDNITSVRDADKTNQPWEITFSELQMGEKLSEGSYGVVFKGTWLGTTVAIKIPHQHISDELKEKFLDEVIMMSKLHHPNIVIFLGACVKKPNIALVLEYLEQGSLHDFMHSDVNQMNPGLAHHFAMDIARGTKYLHTRASIVQRDLKPRNLLIDYAFNMKICDFGLSKFTQADNNTMTACGTPYWTAPEVIRNEHYGNKADVYSFAIILWQLITLEDPYGGSPGLEVAVKVAHSGLRPDIPQTCPDYYRSLMESCWDDDPKKRPNFTVITDKLLEIKKTEGFVRLAKKQQTFANLDTSSPPSLERKPSFTSANAKKVWSPISQSIRKLRIGGGGSTSGDMCFQEEVGELEQQEEIRSPEKP